MTWLKILKFQVPKISIRKKLFFFCKGNTHIPMLWGETDVDLNAVRGGDQLSEVLLADPETSVFRVCCLLDRGADKAAKRAILSGNSVCWRIFNLTNNVTGFFVVLWQILILHFFIQEDLKLLGITLYCLLLDLQV